MHIVTVLISVYELHVLTMISKCYSWLLLFMTTSLSKWSPPCSMVILNMYCNINNVE